MIYDFYNLDCVEGLKRHIKDNSVDLIITDPPYGINGDKLDKHYNRDESNVIDGYVEVPADKYENFSNDWIKEAERILKPGGSMYIVSGYTNLIHILNALKNTDLEEKNHIIWKYNFGVYTKTKFVSSHYHILYYVKKGKKHTFNTFSRFGDSEKGSNGGSANYEDREDVWVINKEFKPGKIKNKNELPKELLIKMIQYSSNENDVVCDMFLGSFSTAKVAKGLNRQSVGFEISKNAFLYQIKEMEKIEVGELKKSLRTPPENLNVNAGKPLTEEEKESIFSYYKDLISKSNTKKDSIEKIQNKFGRGYWSIERIIKSKNAEQEISSV